MDTNVDLSIRIICILVLVSVIGLLHGCGSSHGGAESGPEIEWNIAMGTFASNEALKTYILDQYAESVLPQSAYGPSRDMIDGPMDGAPAPDAEAGDDSGAAAENDHSETNVQEAGVDEADKVKNDGRYIYVAGDRAVHIVDAEIPSAMRTVGSIAVDGQVDSLYLYDNLLVIIYIPPDGDGHYWEYAGGEEAMDVGFCYWLPVNSETGVMRVDVSDPSLPEVSGGAVIEGNLVSTRRIENRLYLVQQFLPELPQIDYYYGEKQNRDAVIEANKAGLQEVVLEDLIPTYRTVAADGVESDSMQLVSCDRFYKPSATSGGSIVTITTFDLLNPAGTLTSSGVIADAHTIYASTNALYLASTRWNYTAYEDDNTSDIYQTYLFKFNFTADGVACTGAGGVGGKILNQFSLGEYEDVLRIATTNGEAWMGDGRVSNSVFCLKAEDDILAVIGKIEAIAPGESIYAARFLGPRGYLVTFVKIDPLFTLDLSDPYHPEIAGELKVPGYSDYIHPLSDDYLLTIGKDVTLDDGMAWYQGVQLSIFDIRDFENPTLLFQEVIGDRGTHSEALADHKAFTYWASNNLLAIPVDLHAVISPAYPYDYGDYQYSGLFVYAVSTESGFDHLGTLRTDPAGYGYPSSWTRGIFINDHVFAVKEDEIFSAEYDAISTTSNRFDLVP